MEFPRFTPQNFTIVFFPERSATELRIPAYASVVIRKSVTLRDKYKNVWQVKAKKVDGHWYFLDGWAKFVADNSVNVMDMLSFRYSGPGLFDVYMLESNGVEKEGVGCRIDNRKVHQNMESEDEEDDSDNVSIEFRPRNDQKRKRSVEKESRADVKTHTAVGSKRRNIDNLRWKNVMKRTYGSEDEEEDDSDDVSLESPPRNYQKRIRRVEKEFRANVKTPGSKRRTIDNLRGNKVITCRPAPRRKIPSSSAKMSPLRINEMDNKGKGILVESSDNDSETSEEELGSGFKGLKNEKKLKSKAGYVKVPKSKKPMKRVRVAYLGRELLESAGIPRPKGIYFVTKPKPKKMNECYLPMDILNDQDIQLPEYIVLVDPDGRRYTSRLVTIRDGRTFYKGGWNVLAKKNQITENDYYICEFGEGRRQPEYLYVTFIRE